MADNLIDFPQEQKLVMCLLSFNDRSIEYCEIHQYTKKDSMQIVLNHKRPDCSILRMFVSNVDVVRMAEARPSTDIS